MRILILFFIVFDLSAQRVSFDELCEYDSSYCGRLRSGDGFKEPDEDLLRMAYFLKDDIQRAAEEFGVPEAAIAGSFIAENTLNVGISDRVQNFIVQAGISNNVGSVGLGQMYREAQMEAERYIARKEGREPRSSYDVDEDYRNPRTAMRLIAAYLAHSATVYEERAGVDIWNDAGVLTTLYNLGNVESRANSLAQRPESERRPRVNFFGWFVDRYEQTINKVVTTNVDAMINYTEGGTFAGALIRGYRDDVINSLPCNEYSNGLNRLLKKDQDHYNVKQPVNALLSVVRRNYSELNGEKEYPKQMFEQNNKRERYVMLDEVRDCEGNLYYKVNVDNKVGYLSAGDGRKFPITLKYENIENYDECIENQRACQAKISEAAGLFYKGDFGHPASSKIRLGHRYLETNYVNYNNYLPICDYQDRNRSNRGRVNRVSPENPIMKEEFITLWNDLSNACMGRFSWADNDITVEFADLQYQIDQQMDGTFYISQKIFNRIEKIRNHCIEYSMDLCSQEHMQRVRCENQGSLLSRVGLDGTNFCGMRRILADRELSSLIDDVADFTTEKNCNYSLTQTYDLMKKLNETGCIKQFRVPDQKLVYMTSGLSDMSTVWDTHDSSVGSFSVVHKHQCVQAVEHEVDSSDIIDLNAILND